MRREDLLAPNPNPFGKNASSPHPHHGPHVHPDVAARVLYEHHPPTAEVYAHRSGPHSHLIAPDPPHNPRPETKSASLMPSDPKHDLGFLQRMADHFTRLLERL